MFRPPTNRIKPRLPVQAYTSWEVRAPLAQTQDFWRKATCAEVDCPRYLGGFVARIDETTTLGQAQATYLRKDRTRRAVESRDTGLTVFTYGPGTICFKADEHLVRTERPSLFIRRGGDWRATTEPATTYARPEQWVEDFAAHQNRLARAQN